MTQAKNGDTVRIMGVDDVGPQPPDDSRKPPCGRQIHLGARRDGNQVEPLRGATSQLAVGMRDQGRPLPDRSQAVHGQQHLVLAATPSPCCVHVKGKHWAPEVLGF